MRPSEPGTSPTLKSPRQNPPPSLRLERRGIERRGAELEIHVDGRPCVALEGESVAAALTAAGVLALRRERDGALRGLYCGMGMCFECRVTIDGQPGRRACLTSVQAGMRVDSEGGQSTPDAVGRRAGALPVAAPAMRHKRCAILVIGAGPAGLAAAEAAAERGAEVAILDERPVAGGQYYKPLAASHEFARGKPLDRQFGAGARLLRKVVARGVQISSGTLVWDALARPEGGVSVHALDAQGPIDWAAGKLIVATGAFERSWPVPGWTLPGVMTTGAAQTLARAYRVAPGRRVLIAGNGPLNLQVAADLACNGVQIVAVAEAAAAASRAPLADLARLFATRPDLALQGLRYLYTLRARGVPLLYRHVLIRVEGDQQARRAVLAAIDASGRVIAGSERGFDIDAVCCGYGLSPSSELTRLIGCRHEVDARNGSTLIAVRDADGRTSIADIFVAGDAGGAWGAHSALHQGRIAGAAAAADMRGPQSRTLAGLRAVGSRTAGLGAARRGLGREARFQTALWRVFAMPPIGDRLATDDTVVCRCESVRFGEVRRAIARGAADLGEIKRITRCGMGHCQGRYCSQTIAGLLARASGIPAEQKIFFLAQAPLRPVPLGAVALTAEDAAAPTPLVEPPGATPAQNGTQAVTQPVTIGTLVIGAGVVGLCIARELARRGEDVIVIDRGLPHAEASGVNAGSMHVQFQTFGFADLSTDAARNAATTLALQRDSVYLWEALAAENGTDCEIEIDGGLTVADDVASLVHLHRKVKIERAAGLEIELITGDHARRLAPCLAPGILAASLSRDEGKLNPLKAAPLALAAALAAGVRVISRTRVTGIDAGARGFVVRTDRGDYAARRVVNAAGAWSGGLAALVGERLPVRPNPIQMLVTEALPPLIAYHLAHATRRLTLKQAASGNLVIGGGWKAVYDARAGRMRPSATGFAANLAVVRDLLPATGAVHVIRSWTGTAFITPPVIGESVFTPGLFHAVTQNGMTLAPVIGRICADLILGRTPPYDMQPFTPARFI